MAQSAAKRKAGYGSRLIVAALKNAVQIGIEQVAATAMPADQDGDGLDAAMSHYVNVQKRQEPVSRLIETTDWYGLEEIAKAEPAAFAAGVFPLVLRVGAVLASPENPRIVEYQRSTEVDWMARLAGVTAIFCWHSSLLYSSGGKTIQMVSCGLPISSRRVGCSSLTGYWLTDLSEPQARGLTPFWHILSPTSAA